MSPSYWSRPRSRRRSRRATGCSNRWRYLSYLDGNVATPPATFPEANAYCVAVRDDLRTFRVDRMRRTVVADEATLAPPNGFDAVEHVSRSLARVPWPWEVEVLLDLPREAAAQRLPATLAELVELDEGHSADDACQVAGLDGPGAGGAGLRLRDPPPGRAPRERPGTGGSLGRLLLSASR